MSYDWNVIYVGLNRDWLSPKEALERVNPNCLEVLETDILGELYLNEDDKEKFVEILDSFLDFTDYELELALKFWMKLSLEKIYGSNLTINDKLNKIASLWSSFDYPREWKKFINYMPVPAEEEKGEKILYEKFEAYLKSI